MVDSDSLKWAIEPEGGFRGPPGLVAGIKAGGFLFFTAIRGRGDGTKEQAKAAFQQLEGLLRTEGATLDHVVRVMVFFQDIADRDDFNEVWRETFTGVPPARMVIQVANASQTPDGDSRFALDITAVAP